MSRAAQQSQRVSELEGLLDVVKSRVQDLEDRCIGKAVQQQSHRKQLQEEALEAQVSKNASNHLKHVREPLTVIKGCLNPLFRCGVRFWSRSCVNNWMKKLSYRGNFISPSKKKSVDQLDRITLFSSSSTKSASRSLQQSSSASSTEIHLFEALAFLKKASKYCTEMI